MQYEQMTQTSRIYKYGEGEEFKTREEAREVANKKMRQVITEICLQKLYEKTEVKVVEAANGFQIVAKISLPRVV